jgi:Na+-transporting NADH:ubiquinone oxidoreductase subunit F
MDWNLELGFVAIGTFVLIGLFLASVILLVRAKLVSTALCKIRINEDSVIETPGGSTLLNVLLQQKIPIPSPCGGKATCKQCKVRVVAGGGAILETDKSTFSKKELDAGWRLSCQCKVRGDLRVAIPHEHLEVKEFVGKVVSNHNVATFIKELVVELPEDLEYASGAYLLFHVPKFSTESDRWMETMDPMFHGDWAKLGLLGQKIAFSEECTRAYSMASFPAEGRLVRFNIRIASPPKAKVPWGVCSSYAFSLKPGDSVRLSGPYGESFMRKGDSPVVFLIGGAGSSFGRSHILHLFNSDKTDRQVDLWYGARSLKENIYEDEYRALAAKHPNFSYHLVLSEPLPEDKWPTKAEDPVQTNFLFKAFELGQLSKMKAPEDCLYYVCGPPMHNKSIMKLLDDYGVARENIVLDDFGN